MRFAMLGPIFAILSVGCGHTPPPAPAPAHAPSVDRVHPLEAAIVKLCEARIAAKEVGSLRVGVVDGDHQWVRSFGVVETPAGIHEADDRTEFEVGSISKTFTALLLAEMVGRGEVRLDQPMADLLPAGTKLGSPDLRTITLEQLSTHRSGLPVSWPTFQEQPGHDPFAKFTEAQLYAGLDAIHALESKPGSAYAYNNFAVALLGHLLARKLGVSYAKAIADRVTGPLGMTDTFADLPATESSRAARGHDEVGTEAYNWSTTAIAPAGSIRSTMPDMLRYARALLTPEGPLAPAIALAITPREDGPSPAVSLGLGFHILEAGRLVFHNGQSSMHSFLAVDRSRALGVVILTDRRGMAVDALGLDILHTVRGDPAKPAPKPHVELDATQRAAVVGHYRLAPTMVIEIREESGQLVAQATGQGANPLVAESPTMLVIRGTQIRLEMVLGTDGKASSLILHQNGKNMPAPRE